MHLIIKQLTQSNRKQDKNTCKQILWQSKPGTVLIIVADTHDPGANLINFIVDYLCHSEEYLRSKLSMSRRRKYVSWLKLGAISAVPPHAPINFKP